MNFYKWLTTQKDANTPIGDLARDMMADRDCPRHSSYFARWVSYLRDKNESADYSEVYQKLGDETEKLIELLYKDLNLK